ncbi:MobF family relaxase [Nocardia sputorum]|uniref:TrwC relaxase domain-containing protein n=2 Tax=Nocardia TaxID=1817 RepID=A0ABM8D105_9NOCA|nr:MobF family relaxase [Nocardia sputorum]BDU00995.1 hypothetical protein IFM12276_40230 [Nocardia sputorum]
MTATIHKVVAGNGFQYYLRDVAAQDATSRGRSSLADYYSAKGETPGHWHGAGLAALGIAVGDEVTEEQMKSLFGLGRHPNADVIEAAVIDEQIWRGAKLKDADRAADKASRLGNPFRVYAEVSEFRKRCATAFEEHNYARGYDPHTAIPDAERARIRTVVATEMFTEEYGRAPLDVRELSGWVARNSRPNTTAVAGFDLTFSPVKSVSALWTLAPRAVAEKMEAAHHAAVDDAIEWLERHATFTRLGRNGVRQVDVEGVVAARFTHRDSRAGDPDLHTHMLIANRVRTLDGRWRTLDGTAIYQSVVTVSEIYNTRLEHHLRYLIGVEFAERSSADVSKRPIREIVGIPESLIQMWSQRDAAITGRLDELAAQFQQQLGREPTPGEVYELADLATVQTRPRKHELRTLAEQRATWRADAIALFGGRTALSRMVAAALDPPRTPPPIVSSEWITRTAEQVLAVVSEQRSTWRRHHVRAEIERQTRGQVQGEHWEHVTEAILAEALSPRNVISQHDPDISDEPVLGAVPQLLRRRDGSSVYATAGAQVYTSAHTLAVERQLIDLSVQPGERQLPRHLVTEAVHAYNQKHPDRPLNPGQITVIDRFAQSGLRVHTANAPAGSGKTTAMRVLTDAWHRSGGYVLGFAPTAAAAAVLSDAIGTRVETVDRLLTILDRHSLTLDDGVLEPGSLPQWVVEINTDTLVIVDEHVKLGNAKRLRLLKFLTERGATIRCIGDDHQLPAIEAGGADADMNSAAPDHTLTLPHVVRFASTAEATASLQLRSGDPAALGWYLDNGRVNAGHHGATHDDAYTGWITDHLSGRDSIMLAATHDVVTALNSRARADRIARTEADTGPECVLADGLRASVGDVIRTRRNNPRLRLGAHDWVRNGYTWLITAVHNDGSLTATHLHPRDGKHNDSVRFPADYVRAHVRLGYATTIDSAQGITADTCHIALTGAESRQQLYVAMTRGVHGNYVYVPTAVDGSEASLWSEPAVSPHTAVEVLVCILDRDGTQKSAHTQVRDALDPFARLGRAVDIYLDTIGLAAEDALGPAGLARLDAGADIVHPHLTDSPAYPILRQHLAVIAMTGRDPLTALHTAAAARELDTAHDPAAVLDWRLDTTGTHSSGIGPLPWIRGIPDALDTHPLADQLLARQRIITDLAHQIHDHTRTWTLTTTPHWARPLREADPQLVADLAVWRASLHIPDHDPRPTGPPRYATIEGEYQQRLRDRLTAEHEDLDLPVNKWAPVVRHLDPRITTDPYWPTLATKLEAAERAEINIVGLLTDAASNRPLPDEMPAAALWSRLECSIPDLEIGLGDRPAPRDAAGDALHSSPETNALVMLTDEELDRHIGELELGLALVDTDTFIFNPATYKPLESDLGDAAHRHHAAQEAIRHARHADQQLQTAIRAADNVANDLHSARAELDAAPRYRRGHRRRLQARINTLVVERNIRDRECNSAHDSTRSAHRHAALLAGPEQDWGRILTSHPEPSANELPQLDTALIDEEATEHTAYIREQLGEYRAEQRRRSTLSAAERAVEEQVRHRVARPGEYASDADKSMGIFDREHDTDLGL